MMNIDSGMKVRINKMYCDVNPDGFTRGSDLRYVVLNMHDGYCLLAKTRKQANNGEGFIYHSSVVVKVDGYWC